MDSRQWLKKKKSKEHKGDEEKKNQKFLTSRHLIFIKKSPLHMKLPSAREMSYLASFQEKPSAFAYHATPEAKKKTIDKIKGRRQ